MTTTLIRIGAALAAAGLAASAHAHPGHNEGALAGLLHPLAGIDHLLAILAVGMWAAHLGGRARLLLPASFILAMGLAAGAAVAGLVLPAFEPGIAGSLLLAGLLLVFRVRIAPAAGAAIVAAFAVFHGYAHGAELPQHAAAWLYFAGFLATSAALLFAGRSIAIRLEKWRPGLSVAGMLVAASGGWMAVSLP